MLVILIADDSDLARGALARLLRRNRFRVVEAETGDEVIAALRTVQVHVAILDFHMAHGGLPLLRRLRMLRPRLPVLLLTGRSASDFEGAGYDRVLEKPVDEADLIAAIAELTGG